VGVTYKEVVYDKGEVGVWALWGLKFRTPTALIKFFNQPLVEIPLLMWRGIVLLVHDDCTLRRTPNCSQGIICW
jgi:hypothetical protein